MEKECKVGGGISTFSPTFFYIVVAENANSAFNSSQPKEPIEFGKSIKENVGQ